MSRTKAYPCQRDSSGEVTRRDFLRLAGAAAAGLVAAGCQAEEPAPAVNPAASAGGGSKPRVAVTKATEYKEEELDNLVAGLIDQLGGLGDVVKVGDSVAIKVNLTGGTKSGSIPGHPAIETFVTHPLVVKSLIKQVQAAGAKEVYIVEAVYEWESYKAWGYEEIAEATGATLIDLNEATPYPDFIEAAVGDDSFVYPTFTFNQLLKDVDVFMSVSKMKNHQLAGVTHTMKNLYGLVPYRFYRLSSRDTYRSSFHGTGGETRTRVPKIIVDLNRARPIHFGLVDGIKTTEGGEGPWIATCSPIVANLLVAGKNVVATDAVATALMTCDPAGNYPDEPYLRCENHIGIAAAMGLGTNKLEEIEVVGEAIEKVRVKFSPAL
ncbi:MAG: DUF362 domain-containing protein [Chloroflexota bacterium]